MTEIQFKERNRNLTNPEANDKKVKQTRTPLLLPDTGFCLADRQLLGSPSELSVRGHQLSQQMAKATADEDVLKMPSQSSMKARAAMSDHAVRLSDFL